MIKFTKNKKDDRKNKNRHDKQYHNRSSTQPVLSTWTLLA